MPLAILVEDKLNRLIRDRLNFLVKRFSKHIGRAAVYDDHALSGNYEAEIVVMTRVLVGRRGGCANGRVDAGDIFDRFGIQHTLRVLVCNILACPSWCGQSQDNRQRSHHYGSPMNL